MADKEEDVINAADETKVRELKNKERLKARQYAADFKHVIGTPQGRRLLRVLLERSGLYRLSYEGGDSEATAFNEGSRNQGLQLQADIERHGTPEQILKIILKED